MFDIEFWKNFVSSAIATLIGVIIDIPIALWINRIQPKTVEHSEKEKFEEETNAKRRKIILLISDELKYNQIILSDYKFENLHKLKPEAWSALSDGGELQWIEDISLLDAVSMAYYSIKTVIYSLDLSSGDKLFNLAYGINVPDPEQEKRHLRIEHISKNVEFASAIIDNVFRIINRKSHLIDNQT